MAIWNRLKIDERVSNKKLSDQIWKNMGYMVGELKTLTILKLILIDALVIFFLLVPVMYSYIFLTVPIWLALTVWQVRLHFKNAYTVQSETVLFTGMFGLSGAVIHLFISHKIAYYYIGITWPLFYVLIVVVYGTIAWIIVRYQLKRFTDWRRTPDRKGTKNNSLIMQAGALLAGAPALGYSFAQAAKKNESVLHVMLLFCMLFFSVLLFYIAAKFLLRYFFMKANPHLAKLQKPGKKESVQGITPS